MADGKVSISTELDNSGIEKDAANLPKAFDRLKASLKGIEAASSGAFGAKQQKQIDALGQKLARQTESIEKQKNAVQSLQDKRDLAAAKDSESISKQESLVDSLSKKWNEVVEASTSRGALQEELTLTQAAAESLRIKYDALIESRKKLLEYNREQPTQRGTELATQARTQSEFMLSDLEKLEQKTISLRDKMAAIKFEPESDKSIQLKNNLDLATQKLQRLQAQAAATGSSLDRDLGLGADKLTRLKDEAAATNSQLENLKNAPDKSTSAFKRLSSAVGGVGVGIAAIAKKGVTAMGKLFASLKRVIGGLINTKKHTNSAGSAVQKFGKRIAQLAVAALVFNVIRRALRELTDYLGAAMKTNNQFVASLALIKGNLLTAFQPIFEAIMPALNALMAGLAKVTAYIAAFVNLLFGKSIQASKDSASALYNQTKALNATGAAAKKAAGALAVFDEINVLTQADASGGAETIMPDFSYDFSEIEDFFKQFETIPDAFYAIGKKIAEAIANALSNIDWVKVKATARTIAVSIAEFINGFIDTPELWYELGHTLGEGLNTAFEFMEEFAGRLKWHELGQMLAYGLNTAIEFWDPKLAGRAIYKNLNGILDTIYTFFTDTNWGELGREFAIGLNTLFDGLDWDLLGRTFASQWQALISGLYNFVTTFDWTKFGVRVAAAINGWFSGIDWAMAARTISDGLNGVLTSMISFVRTMDWQKIGRSIGEFITNINWGELIENILILAGEAAIGLDKVFSNLSSTLLMTIPAVESTVTEFQKAYRQAIKITPEIKSMIEIFRTLMDTFLRLDPSMTGYRQALNGLIDSVANVPIEIERYGDDISVATKTMLDPILDMADEASTKITELFLTGKPIVATDTAEISGYFTEMANIAISELERMKQSATDNLAIIFGEEAQNYEARVTEANKSYDSMIAEIDRKDKALENSVRIAKVQFGVESEEYKNAVNDYETHTSSKIGQIDKINTARTEELQSIKNNAGEEVSAYIQAKEGMVEQYDAKITKTENSQQEINDIIKQKLLDGETLTEEDYKLLQGMQGDFHDDTIEALVTNNSEQKSLQKTRKDNAVAIQTKEKEDILAQAKIQRDESIDLANETYEKKLEAAENLRIDGTAEQKAMVDDLIEEAKRERNDSITLAEEKFKGIKDATKTGGGEIKGAMDESNKDIEENWLTFLGQLLIDAIRKFSQIRDAWNSLWGNTSVPSADVSAGTGRGRSSMSAFRVSSYPNIPIPALATGAVLPPNRPFVAMVGDQKSGMNVEAPASLITDIVRAEIGGLAPLLEELIQAVKSQDTATYLDGQRLNSSIQRAQNQRGVNLVQGAV